MSTSLRLAATIMVGCGGVLAGMIVCFAVERINLWARMPVEQYAVDFRRSVGRVDPLQPILLVVAAAGAIWFALTADGTASTFAWLGVGGLAFVMAISIAMVRSMNVRFLRVPEGTLPDDAREIRERWARLHVVRTVAVIAAQLCLVLAITYA